MKLNLLFIAMDLLTLLAYPIVFVHNKICMLSKLKENTTTVKLLVTISVTADK